MTTPRHNVETSLDWGNLADEIRWGLGAVERENEVLLQHAQRLCKDMQAETSEEEVTSLAAYVESLIDEASNERHIWKGVARQHESLDAVRSNLAQKKGFDEAHVEVMDRLRVERYEESFHPSFDPFYIYENSCLVRVAYFEYLDGLSNKEFEELHGQVVINQLSQ